jgi:YHS domain-containing protein
MSHVPLEGNFLEACIMVDTTALANQIDAEFNAVAERMKKFQSEQVSEHKERQQRLEKLGKVFDELRDTWRPSLELLLKKFGDRVKVTPRIVPSTREATFEFQSSLANVKLTFAAYTDRDIRKLILSYDLEIIPVLMRFPGHAEIEFPLDAVDKAAAGKWINERVLDFVRTYLSLGDNEWYLKDQMVEDPVAKVRFPKQAAACTLDWQGQTYYFVGAETRREFAQQNKINL